MSEAGPLVIEACRIYARCGYALRFGNGGARWLGSRVSWTDPVRRVVWLRKSAQDEPHEAVAPLYAHEAMHVLQQSDGIRRANFFRRVWWATRYATSATFRWRVEVEAEAVEAWARWVIAGRPPVGEGSIRKLISAPSLAGNRPPYKTGRTEDETIAAIVVFAKRYIIDNQRPWGVS